MKFSWTSMETFLAPRGNNFISWRCSTVKWLHFSDVFHNMCFVIFNFLSCFCLTSKIKTNVTLRDKLDGNIFSIFQMTYTLQNVSLQRKQIIQIHWMGWMDSEIFLAKSILASGDEEIEGAHGIAEVCCLSDGYGCLNDVYVLHRDQMRTPWRDLAKSVAAFHKPFGPPDRGGSC